MSTITWDTVWRVLISSSIVILGIPIILYIPVLLRVIFLRYLKLEVAYKSPKQCYHESKLAKKDLKESSFYYTDNPTPTGEESDFFGYYSQQYFSLSPTMRYIRTNGFLLFYVIVQILVLMSLGLAIIWAMDADPTSIFASAAIATTIAVFHLADYLRGYFAYIWLVWSNKLKLGDEIVVENHRGVVVEMGPMVTVLYVFMVGIPLIGSVPTTAPSNDSKPSEDSLAKEGKFVTAHQKGDHEQTVLHQIPSSQLPPSGTSAQRFVTQREHQLVSLPPNVPQLPYNMIRNHSIPFRPMIGHSENNPQTLRHFNKIKPDQYHMHGEDGTTVPGEKSLSANGSLASHNGEFIMHRIGYVALPVKEHYNVLTPTCNFLMSSFRHFDYQTIGDYK